jgi:hypothetical protein
MRRHTSWYIGTKVSKKAAFAFVRVKDRSHTCLSNVFIYQSKRRHISYVSDLHISRLKNPEAYKTVAALLLARSYLVN